MKSVRQEKDDDQRKKTKRERIEVHKRNGDIGCWMDLSWIHLLSFEHCLHLIGRQRFEMKESFGKDLQFV
jgi:hypothetical protein